MNHIDAFKAYLVERKGVSKNTLESYLRDIGQYVSYLDSEKIAVVDAATENIEGFIDHLKKLNKSAATVTRMLASIRSFYQFLISEQKCSANPAKPIKLEKTEKKLPEILTDKEILTLLNTPSESDPKGVRDKAMLEILYATGMRVSELINLNLSDAIYGNGKRGEIICNSGKNTRHIPMYPEAVESLRKYIENVRPNLISPESGDALFVNLNGARLSRQGFWKIVKNYADLAGIDKEITPHTLRHSFALHLYQNGASLHDLQVMLGHADISSTQMYATMSKKSSCSDVYDRCHPLAARSSI